MKTVLAAAAIAATMMVGSAVAAKADTQLFFGPITETGPSFTYPYQFTLSSSEYLIGVSASTSKKGITFTSVSVDGSLIAAFGSTASFSIFPTIALAAGSHTVDISGSGKGGFNGSITLSTVPLPTSVALFGTAVMGLGVAGAMRRKGSKAVVSATA